MTDLLGAPEIEADAPVRKRRVMREHIMQARGVVPWATKAALDVPHEFMAFDSAGKQTDDQRMFAAARGVTKGTPDTVLFLAGLMPVWVELKWDRAKPDEDQMACHARLRALGHFVDVAWSVEGMFLCWEAAGVPMRAGALVAAQVYDGRVAAVLAKLDGNGPKKKSRPRKPSPRSTFSVPQGHRTGVWR